LEGQFGKVYKGTSKERKLFLSSPKLTKQISEFSNEVTISSNFWVFDPRKINTSEQKSQEKGETVKIFRISGNRSLKFNQTFRLAEDMDYL